MILEINALDTLFFRNGKPFGRGEDTWADGHFPPSPSVIYGALRGLYFAQNTNDLSKAGKGNDPTRKLQITHIWYQDGNTVLIPAPLDLVEKKYKDDDSDRDYVIKQGEKQTGFYSTQKLRVLPTKELIGNFKRPLPFLSYYEENVEELEDGLLTQFGYEDYLEGAPEEPIDCKKMQDYWILEPKLGIARSKITRTTEEGKLYRLGMLRPKESYKNTSAPISFKINVAFEGLDINANATKFGAEGKAVRVVQKEQELDLSEKIEGGQYFRIQLLSPAIFDEGWQPNGSFFEGINVKLLNAVVGKATRVGGFDMAEKEPKIMYSTVPAGSVFYYKVENMTCKDIFEKIKDKVSFSDQRKKEGFGLYVFSSVDFESLIVKN